MSEEYIRKPEWLRIKTPLSREYGNIRKLMQNKNLFTVCEEAKCPNRSECWGCRTAAFMILGEFCTRSCRFCNVKTGKPSVPDVKEPENLAETVKAMNLVHVVVTSVARDDLKDGGATQFVRVMEELRKTCPDTTVELLTPDFKGKENALEKVVRTKPDIFNHNLETVERLYPEVRMQANYEYSLKVLADVKNMDSRIYTKSGIMVGLGEKEDEVYALMDDLRENNVDFITVGQYMQPSKAHYPVKEYIHPDIFEKYKEKAYEKGFKMVSSSPFTRSSHHASEDFRKLLEAEKK